MSKSKYSAVGGQALIEGIMMKSPAKTAMAVRNSKNEIELCDLKEVNLRKKNKLLNAPVIRGVLAFAESLINGYRALMLSAEKSGLADFEEDTQNDSGEAEKKQSGALITAVMAIGTVLGVALSVVLFMYLPRLVVGGLEWGLKTKFSPLVHSLAEQFLKLSVFVLYVWAVSFMKDIKRTFMYHGAEHKTIFCFEKGLELNVENVSQQKRFHPRCGTSFMILMILISVIISTVVQILFKGVYDSALVWVLIKLLLIPLTCGIGYEILKLCGKYDNILTKIISAPGLWLQRITVKEPDRDMIEVAIAALKACTDEEKADDNI